MHSDTNFRTQEVVSCQPQGMVPGELVGEATTNLAHRKSSVLMLIRGCISKF